MTDRIIGPSGSRRRRFWRLRFLILPIVAIAAGAFFITGASAVHDEAFELDGNIDDANPAGGPEIDWDNDIVAVGATGFSAPQTSLPLGFSAATAGPDFTTETNRKGDEVAVTADNTTFTTNSKDILDISDEWRCVRANNVTDKGDLVNTYAVAYRNAAGELILYFGAEKNDASGTNNLGVWFLQDPTVNCTGGQGGNGTPFTGDHVVGDILVVSQFTNGGSSAGITAYRWDPTNVDAVNNLVKLGDSGICGGQQTDDRLCAITNTTASVNPPWKTWDKDTGSLDEIDTQQFYEGAINVTAFDVPDPCITTLLTNTRSSVETSATLYDYARVPFNVCAPTGTTTRQFVYPQDKARITVDGGGTLTGNLTFQLFDDLDACQADPVVPATVKFSQTFSAANVPPNGVSGSSPQTKTTTNYPGVAGVTPYAITDGTTHYWKVSYHSTDAFQLDSESKCVETTAVSFAGNDVTNITVP